MSSEFLKSNPMTLHHCLLYEFLQKKNVDESFKFFCKKVGKDVIDFEEFKTWFDRFAEGKFDEKPISDLKTVLQNDKKAVRACIVYESLKEIEEEKKEDDSNFMMQVMAMMMDVMDDKKEKTIHDPIFDTFKKMCKSLGDDVIEYQDYYSYYQKFSRGEMDLEDLEQDDKNKKIVTLTDMPLDVMNVIGEKIDYYDRCALRKVTRNLRELIDTSKFKLSSFNINVSKDKTTMSPGSFMTILFSPKIEYVQKGSDCHVAFGRGKKAELEDSDHLKMALNDMKILLENPKFDLNNWEIHMGSYENCQDFHDIFGSLNSKIHVENVEIKGEKLIQAISILPLFEPGVLKRIDLETRDFCTVEDFEPIIKMDQWKQAKTFYMDNFAPVPIENLFHFNKFYVGFPELTMDDIKKIKDVLFKDPNFKSADFCFVDPNKVNNETLQAEFGNPKEEGSNILFYPIPDSKDYIEIAPDFYEDGDDPYDFMTGNAIAFTRKSE